MKFDILSDEEVARVINNHREPDLKPGEIPWIYQDTNAVRQVLSGATQVTAFNRTFMVKDHGSMIFYQQIGHLTPCGMVRKERFKIAS